MEETAAQPGTVVQPTGDTLNGSNGPVESAHQHERAAADDRTVAASQSPIVSAHDELQDNQGRLHEKIAVLAKRLERVLASPFSGEQKASDNAKPTNGLSPTVRRLEESTAQTQNSEHIVDHLLNNLEV